MKNHVIFLSIRTYISPIDKVLLIFCTTKEIMVAYNVLPSVYRHCWALSTTIVRHLV